jgi:hypothetical protein
MKSRWVSDWVIWVAMECSRHDLSIFPKMFGLGTAVKQGSGGWYLSHDSMEGATYEIVFPAVQISTAAGVRAQWLTTLEKLFFCTDMLNCLKEYNLFLDKIVSSDEATFHLSGKVNHHNLFIWGSQNPLQAVKVHRRWIGCGSCIPWPPRSPNMIPMNFSFRGFMKDTIPPIPVDLQEIRDRIVNTIALVVPISWTNCGTN